jgi:multidrug efflux pump subunit AcrB
MIIMILAGIWAIKSIPVQLDPPQHQPYVFVEVTWQGASAEDVADLITVPIENQIRNINGIKEVKSKTTNGYTNVVVIFNYDVDIALAVDQVKQRVASIRNLPADIEVPRIHRNIDREPVAVLTVSGTGDINELIPIVRKMEKELLNRGIEGVDFDGLPIEEIALMVSGKNLHELGLTLDEIATQISTLSQNVPGGTIGRGQGTRQLRSLDQKRDPLEFEQLYLGSGDHLVRYSSFGDVVRRPVEGQAIVTRKGQPAVEMTLWRNTSSDAYAAKKILNEWLDETRPLLPQGVEVTVTNDVWQLLGAQLNLIVKNGLSGLALVILTLFIFLNGRIGLWVMVGIPLSFLLSMAFLYGIFGFGLSIIVLFGFIMALGIVVDDAIVVAEDAATHFNAGHTALDSVIAGAQRMWVPVATSSLTTMAAFIPILIVGGVMGDVIMALPAALLCIIVASLVECFLVLPGHLRYSLANTTPPSPDSFRIRFDTAFSNFRDQKFKPLVSLALNYPGATVCAALGSAIIAFSLIASERVAFSMNIGFSPQSLSSNIEFSASASNDDKLQFIHHLEQTLIETNASTDNVKGWLIKRNTAEFNEEKQTGIQFASLNAQYAYTENRTVDPRDFLSSWTEKIIQPPYVEQLITAVEGGINNGRADITMVLSGDDLQSLKAGSEELRQILGGYPGVFNVIDNLPYGAEQLIFELTPAGRSLGLTSSSLGRQLRSAYSGRRVQIFNQNESELEVRVSLPDAERDDLASLQQLPIKTPAGNFVLLSSVANFYNRRGIDLIRHTNSRMSIHISANVDKSVNNPGTILADLKENVLPDILARNNLVFGLGGSSYEEQVILQTMALGSVLTLLLIYLILAWVFSSYLWPLAIMAAIPFGLTGGVFGHWFMGMDLSAMSLLALLALSGIVVNDSIVLISFVKREVDAGTPIIDSLKKAVAARFRAVILTSLTTIAGLSPLMFETSSLAMMVTPIAVTICFGLLFATSLILLVIPALILLLEELKNQLNKLVRHLIVSFDVENQHLPEDIRQ